MTDLFDSVIDSTGAERPAFRQAPVGDYLVVVREARKVTAGTGSTGIELSFTMREYFGDEAALEGVDLAKCRLKDTLWVTEKTIDFTKEKLARITDEVKGVSFTEALDILPGQEVVVKVAHITKNRQGEELKTPWLEVKGYYSTEWYFSNRKAA